MKNGVTNNKKTVRVLECIRQGFVGGGESHLLSLVENIDRTEFDPVVLSFSDGPMIEKLNRIQVKNYVIPSKKAFDLRVWKPVKELMLKEHIDLVHVHGSRAISNTFWAARSLNIPIIYTIHGWSFHPDQNKITQKMRIMGERFLTSRSDKNISVSHSNQQTGKKFIKSFDSIVIPNGIDQKKFNPQLNFPDLRSELGIDKNETVILFLARFTSHKQPLELIKAFSKAYQTNNSLHLLMVGDGDQKQEGIDLAEKLGISNKVTFLPFRDDVPNIIAATDIYVLPSLWEGLPIGLLEAMAMGKAVIGTRVDGTSEVIEPYQNGLLIDPDRLQDELVENIHRLSTNMELRKVLEENARKTINEKYSVSSMTKQIETVYCQVLEAN
jgi:glycosyltransferase involved in cell wall biosynthesis